MEKPQKTSRRVRGTITGLNETARTLRHDLTLAEEVLWNALRGRKLGGLKFRRQHPVGRFILDFFCAEHRLVVELDGNIHVTQAEHDTERSRMLSEFGYRVLRFRNEEVFDDLTGVLRRISEAALTPGPSPKFGRGEAKAEITTTQELRNVLDSNLPSPKLGRGAGGEGR